MSKSYQQPPQDSLDESNFSPKSFIIFCLDETGNIAFEASWGDTAEDIKKFALLLHKINIGEFENMILDQLKIQEKEKGNSNKNYNTFNKAYKELKKPTDLVVDPTNVELN
jgi:hypothetical protein